jgi:CRISPR-associated protein Csd1
MLQEIIAYSETHLAKSEPGFKAREVRWLIEISSDGRFLAAVPLGDGRRGKTMTHCPEMSGMNSGGKSHFLVETAQTGVQFYKNDEDPKNIAKSEIRHRFFVGLIREASRTVPRLEPLAVFLDNMERLAEVRQALSQNKAKPSDWIVWRIDDFDPREDSEVQAWWREWRRPDQAEGSTKPGRSEKSTEENTMTCFLTGNPIKPLATHPKISGLSGVGGLAMGRCYGGFRQGFVWFLWA